MPPHHPRRQIQHDVQIGLHHRTKVRPLRRPLIGAVIEHAGDDSRIVGPMVGTDVITLLEIGRRPALKGLSLQRLVTAIGVRARFVDCHFLLDRQSKKRSRFLENIIDQRFGDAVVADVEKSFIKASGAQLRPDLLPIGGVRTGQTRNINDRKRCGTDPRRLKRARHWRSSLSTGGNLRLPQTMIPIVRGLKPIL